tara:strand:+ start:724 stop:1161 length:438 start_codon:yes stop_codon:yes gene_type:complete
MALVDQDLESVIHILKINEIKRLGKEQSEMEEDNKLVININDDEGITKVANALGNISELAVMFMYEIYKYGDMSEDEMETREKAFSGAMTIVFQSLFGEDNYDVAKMFIKKYDGIMRKKIEDLGDKAKESNMFDLDSLSDIVNPN